MQPGWCQPVRQGFMENECEALPGVAYPGVRDNCSTLNTKTGYDDDDDKTLAVSLFYIITVFTTTKRNSNVNEVLNKRENFPDNFCTYIQHSCLLCHKQQTFYTT